MQPRKRHVVSNEVIRAEAREALRDSVPLLRDIAEGRTPGVTERDRARACRLLKHVEADARATASLWPDDL
jgi:hypothetical protein